MIEIVQRFANAHQHDMGNRQTGIHLSEQHLIQHLKGFQLPHQAAQG